MDTIPKYTLITCSRKGHPIGELTVPMNAGDLLRLSNVSFASGQHRMQGEVMRCKMCNGRYFLEGKLHTSSGWLPADPVIEGAKPVKKYNRGQIKKRANPHTIEKAQAKALKKLRKDKKDKDK
jgi:hypothetical protein